MYIVKNVCSRSRTTDHFQAHFNSQCQWLGLFFICNIAYLDVRFWEGFESVRLASLVGSSLGSLLFRNRGSDSSLILCWLSSNSCFNKRGDKGGNGSPEGPNLSRTLTSTPLGDEINNDMKEKSISSYLLAGVYRE